MLAIRVFPRADHRLCEKIGSLPSNCNQKKFHANFSLCSCSFAANMNFLKENGCARYENGKLASQFCKLQAAKATLQQGCETKQKRSTYDTLKFLQSCL